MFVYNVRLCPGVAGFTRASGQGCCKRNEASHAHAYRASGPCRGQTTREAGLLSGTRLLHYPASLMNAATRTIALCCHSRLTFAYTSRVNATDWET